MRLWLLNKRLEKTTKLLNRMRVELDQLHIEYGEAVKETEERIRALVVEKEALRDQCDRTARMANWLESGGFHGD